MVFLFFFKKNSASVTGVVLSWNPPPQNAPPGTGPQGRLSLKGGAELLLYFPSHQQALPVGSTITLKLEDGTGHFTIVSE